MRRIFETIESSVSHLQASLPPINTFRTAEVSATPHDLTVYLASNVNITVASSASLKDEDEVEVEAEEEDDDDGD